MRLAKLIPKSIKKPLRDMKVLIDFFRNDLRKLKNLIRFGAFRDAKLCIDGYPRSANDKFGFSINSVDHEFIVEQKRRNSEDYFESEGRPFTQFPLPTEEKKRKKAELVESILKNPESEKCINLYKVIEKRFSNI